MWSTPFLRFGLLSGLAIAASTLALMWLAIFLFTGAQSRSLMPANIALFGIVGIAAYPACWYAVIFRSRSYSRGRIALLVIVTFVVSCALVAAALRGYAAYRGVGTWPSPAEFTLAMVTTGAVILALPYAATATPMALLHRRWLSGRFGVSS